MKKTLIILITIPLIFSSCEKEDDSPNPNSNNSNNPYSGTTGYMVKHFSGDEYEVYKTTNSGSTWTLQGTQYWSGFDRDYDVVDFVD